ncbi:antiterminator LoaP [Bacillus sp. CB62A.1]
MKILSWYALSVRSGYEDLVKSIILRNLKEPLVNVLVPKKTVPEKRKGNFEWVTRKLFPGYILINTEMDAKLYYKLKEIPNCYNFLNKFQDDNNIYFLEIPDQEITPIVQLLNEKGTIECSKAYLEDSTVKIKSGPLRGREGIIKKIDKRKKRAKLLLNFLGDTKMIDVGLTLIIE